MTIATIFMSFFGTQAAGEEYMPITLAQAKAHLRVDTADDDDLIGSLIDAAAAAVESETGIICKARTVTLNYQAFAARMPMLYAPVNAITSVAYIDTAGEEQTLASNQYRQRVFAGVPVLNPAYGVAWPATDAVDGAVTITINAGHTTNAAIDDRIKQAAKLMVGHWYANREAVMAGVTQEVPLTVRYLLSGLRLTNVA